MPLRTALPDTASSSVSSASTFEFTPACARRRRTADAGDVVAPAVRDRDDAGHDVVGHLDRHLDLARARAARARARRRRARGGRRRRGARARCSACLPLTSVRQVVHPRVVRAQVAAADEHHRAVGAARRASACRRGDVGDERLGRELDLAARRAQRARAAAAPAARGRCRAAPPRGRRASAVGAAAQHQVEQPLGPARGVRRPRLDVAARAGHVGRDDSRRSRRCRRRRPGR